MGLNKIPSFQEVKNWANGKFNYFDSGDARNAVDNSNVSVGYADDAGDANTVDGQHASELGGFQSSDIIHEYGTFTDNGSQSAETTTIDFNNSFTAITGADAGGTASYAGDNGQLGVKIDSIDSNSITISHVAGYDTDMTVEWHVWGV